MHRHKFYSTRKASGKRIVPLEDENAAAVSALGFVELIVIDECWGPVLAIHFNIPLDYVMGSLYKNKKKKLWGFKMPF